MTNKLQNKIDELIKLEELHNIKEQYKQHEKTKGLYEQFDFKPFIFFTTLIGITISKSTT